jgi:hypothetical protein
MCRCFATNEYCEKENKERAFASRAAVAEFVIVRKSVLFLLFCLRWALNDWLGVTELALRRLFYLLGDTLTSFWAELPLEYPTFVDGCFVWVSVL